MIFIFMLYYFNLGRLDDIKRISRMSIGIYLNNCTQRLKLDEFCFTFDTKNESLKH